MRRECLAAGFETAKAFATAGDPIVVAQLRSRLPAAPTVLIYGHYDVQPADPAEWATPPFAAVIRDGRIYGRGVSDDKAPLLINLGAVRACRELDGGVPCNLTYVIEGDEERSAEPLRAFSAQHAELLAADVVQVADSWMHAPRAGGDDGGARHGRDRLLARDCRREPALRHLRRRRPERRPRAARLLASLHDERGRVAVDGFYDRVEEVGDDERARWAAFAPDPAAFLAEAGARALAGEQPYPLLERIWARPTLESTAPGAATRARASTRSCRLARTPS